MTLKSKAPVFLVGCPRSGTTLLQSLLAAHPEIASFPESKFFQYLVPKYEPRRLALGMVSRQLRPRLTQFFENELNRPEMLQRLPRIPLMSHYTRRFIKILSLLAEEQGKNLVLEKTPDHVYYLESIKKFVSGAKIIHLLRSGADVVASLYEVTHQYPQGFGGAWDIDLCIKCWTMAVEISLRHLHQPNHILVRYEHLVEDPHLVLSQLCEFIGVEFDERMLQDYRGVAKQVTLGVEPWKASASQVIQNANCQKFYQLFDEAQQEYILERLSAVNLDEISMKLS
jgi:hypothetical protein